MAYNEQVEAQAVEVIAKDIEVIIDFVVVAGSAQEVVGETLVVVISFAKEPRTQEALA